MHKYKFEQPTASGNDFASDCVYSSPHSLPSPAPSPLALCLYCAHERLTALFTAPNFMA